jgi:hypothetical protein
MKLFTIIIFNFFIALNAMTCDYLQPTEQDKANLLMGKKSKIYDAYKQGKCVLDNALKPLSEEQRKVIANLIAKSYLN